MVFLRLQLWVFCSIDNELIITCVSCILTALHQAYVIHALDLIESMPQPKLYTVLIESCLDILPPPEFVNVVNSSQDAKS